MTISRTIEELGDLHRRRRKIRRHLCAFIRKNIDLSDDAKLRRKSNSRRLGDYCDSDLIAHAHILLKRGGK